MTDDVKELINTAVVKMIEHTSSDAAIKKIQTKQKVTPIIKDNK